MAAPANAAPAAYEEMEGGNKSDLPPPRYSTFLQEERSSFHACAAFVLVIIISMGGACLASQTKDDDWFKQNVTVAISTANIFVKVGSYNTRFGWESFCYRASSSGSYICTKYGDIGNKYADNLATLGYMAYVASALSVALGGVMLLGLFASSGKRSGRKARGGMGCLAAIMAIYYLSAVIISFVAEAIKFLDDYNVASGVTIGWAYGLSLIIFVAWASLTCVLM